MKIKSVTINKYKSITKPVTINFDENLIVFIGKNGSGKSNILEALNCIFSQNATSRRSPLSLADLDGEINLELTEEEQNILKKFSDFDGEGMVTVLIKEGQISTSYTIRDLQFVTVLRNQYNAIINQGNKVIDALQAYAEKLKSILSNVDDALKNYTNFRDVYYGSGSEIYKIEDVINCIKRILPLDYNGNMLSEEDIMERITHFESLSSTGLEKCEFGLAPKLYLMPEKNTSVFVTVDNEGLQKEIAKTNKQLNSLNPKALNDQCKKLVNLIVKYNNTAASAYQVDYNDRERNDEFEERIEEAIFNKSYWIPSGELIFNSSASGNYSANGEVDSQYVDLFVKSFIRLNYSAKKKRRLGRELLEQYNEFMTLNVDSKDFCEKLASFLNRDIPRFDDKMFKRIVVEGSPSRIKLSVEENNGAIVPFYATSLGRRWYFTYYFLKNRLGENDILILDEPASTLHPTAQLEILKDIEKIAQTHTVIMCTHSPYMISDSIKSVKLVELTDKTTEVKSVKLGALPDYIQQAGMLASKDALFNLEKTHVLCEGPSDVACFNAFMKLLDVDTVRYQLLVIGGNTQLQRTLEFYAYNGFPHPIIILDADSKGNKIFDKQIAIPGTNKKQSIDSLISSGKLKVVFAGENTQMNCLEGMFSADDFAKFTEKKSANGKKQYKVRENIAQLLNEHGCSDQTKQNFRELFIKAGMLATK